jgi:hypothetical protein
MSASSTIYKDGNKFALYYFYFFIEYTIPVMTNKPTQNAVITLTTYDHKTQFPAIMQLMVYTDRIIGMDMSNMTIRRWAKSYLTM